jgi:hypothetical protein
MVDAESSVCTPSGTSWKYVPFSPAGRSPSRLASAAMYSVPFIASRLPAMRPRIESSANR